MIVVTLPYDQDWIAVEWAKKHCPSYITNDVHPNKNPGHYWCPKKIDYFFGEAEDATAFALQWKHS